MDNQINIKRNHRKKLLCKVFLSTIIICGIAFVINFNYSIIQVKAIDSDFLIDNSTIHKPYIIDIDDDTIEAEQEKKEPIDNTPFQLYKVETKGELGKLKIVTPVSSNKTTKTKKETKKATTKTTLTAENNTSASNSNSSTDNSGNVTSTTAGSAGNENLTATTGNETNTTTEPEEDYPQGKNYSLNQMYSSTGYKALEYLGYDSDGYFKSKGTTFSSKNVGSTLRKSNNWSKVRCKNDNGKTLDYVSKSIKSDSKDDVYSTGGTECSTYVQYVIFGYYEDVLGYKFTGLKNGHKYYIGKKVAGFASVSRLENTLCAYSKAHPSLISTPIPYNAKRTKAQSRTVAASLKAGDIVCFSVDYGKKPGGESKYHAAVYVGCYNGEYYFAHSGVKGRGPELVTLTALEGGKKSTNDSMRIEYVYRISKQ